MGKCGVPRMFLPVMGNTLIELYFGGCVTRLVGHCVLVNVPEDGLTTSIYHIGGLCIGIRDVSPDGSKRAVRRRQNDQRLLLRASQFDPNQQQLGRPAQSGAPETRSDPLLRASDEPEKEVMPVPRQPTVWKRLFEKRNGAAS